MLRKPFHQKTKENEKHNKWMNEHAGWKSEKSLEDNEIYEMKL